jgi:hypothetical protein
MPGKIVFLSSTFRDLAKHREAVIAAIESLDGYHCVCKEKFGARDWEADAFCGAKVQECDLFIGIVGHLHGSCPPNSAQSYTEREFDAAIAANKSRLMFIAPEDFFSRPISSNPTSRAKSSASSASARARAAFAIPSLRLKIWRLA